MSINEFFDRIYCINIDRRVDRWESCIKEFEKHGLQVERFSAIDGNNEKYNLGYPYDNELAGAMSHLNVLKRSKELGLKNVLILEDDVVFIDNLNELLCEYIKQLPENWDGLHFGGNHILPLRRINSNLSKMSKSYALHAYGINEKSYIHIIEYLNKCINNVIVNGKEVISQSVAADYSMSDVHSKLDFYCFTPHLAWQKEDYSDIQKTKVNYEFLK